MLWLYTLCYARAATLQTSYSNRSIQATVIYRDNRIVLMMTYSRAQWKMLHADWLRTCLLQCYEVPYTCRFPNEQVNVCTRSPVHSASAHTNRFSLCKLARPWLLLYLPRNHLDRSAAEWMTCCQLKSSYTMPHPKNGSPEGKITKLQLIKKSRREIRNCVLLRSFTLTDSQTNRSKPGNAWQRSASIRAPLHFQTY